MTHTRRRLVLWSAVAAATLTAAACRPPLDGKAVPSGASATRVPPGAPSSTAAVETNAVVTHIVDGDTVDVRIAGRTERVRLIGINTPNRG